jgi:hypothetical protein
MELLAVQDRKPSLGGRIGGTGAPGGGLAISVFTDSPLSGANAVWGVAETPTPSA